MGTHPRHSARKGQYKLRRDEDDKICDLSFPSHRSRPIYHSCSSKEGSNGLRGSVHFCSGSLYKCKGRRQACKKSAAISAKTFFEKVFDTFSDTGFPASGLARCANTVDAVQARSTNGMVAYFNSAAKADLEVLTPVCRVATLAYLKAKIAGKKSSKAKVEASAAYLKAFEEYGDDGFACSKSQKFVPEM